MTISFNKTGTRTNSFLGDSFQSEYIFVTLTELPIAKLTYSDFKASIKFNETTYNIERVPGSWTNKYLILDGDSTIGHIDAGSWLNRFSVTLSTDKVFKLKRRYKSVLDRLTNWTNYNIQLQSVDEIVTYEFVKGVSFEKGNSNQRNKELKGKMNVDIDNLPVALFGIFLIEQMLNQEVD
ncbi:MAG: hypothetical protein ACK5R0_12830 [Bacteroidota bacterium]|jgi:hypothetical protein